MRRLRKVSPNMIDYRAAKHDNIVFREATGYELSFTQLDNAPINQNRLLLSKRKANPQNIFHYSCPFYHNASSHFDDDVDVTSADAICFSSTFFFCGDALEM